MISERELEEVLDVWSDGSRAVLAEDWVRLGKLLSESASVSIIDSVGADRALPPGGVGVWDPFLWSEYLRDKVCAPPEGEGLIDSFNRFEYLIGLSRWRRRDEWVPTYVGCFFGEAAQRQAKLAGTATDAERWYVGARGAQRLVPSTDAERENFRDFGWQCVLDTTHVRAIEIPHTAPPNCLGTFRRPIG